MTHPDGYAPLPEHRMPTTAASAAPLGAWLTPAETVEIVQGEDNLAVLAPVLEPLSAGEPPFDPLVESITLGERVARKPVASGQVITHAGDTAPRRGLRLRWSGLTQSQAETLAAWLNDEMHAGALAMTVYPDGRGAAAKAARATGAARFTSEGSAPGGGGIWALTIEAEEVG